MERILFSSGEQAERRNSMKILVVDDEALLVKGILFNLQSEGFQVITGANGLDAIRLTREEKPDLLILDVMMPQLDGLTACRKIREFSAVPIILLTAKSEDTDKLTGFDSGADDYLTKPFNILELKARIRALLRRSGASPEQAIRLDELSRNASKRGVPVELTAREYDLIEFLMEHPGQVFSREALLSALWGEDNRTDGRTVDVYIRRLREKLEDDPAQPKYILTKWSVGYYYRKP